MSENLAFTEVELVASICKDSLFEFVKEFWHVVSSENPVWNWHIEYVCNELQKMAERVFKGLPREYDLIINISPGTTKSTLLSVMLPAWAWTRMPSFKFIGASYAYSLAMDLSRKCRDVVKSDRYKECFPHVQIRDEQDSKGFFVNTANGYRYAVGVNGSVTGMHGHMIVCLPWDAIIRTSAGELPIGKVVDEQLSVKVEGFDHTTSFRVWRDIEAYEVNPSRPLDRIVTSNGKILELTPDHPVYVVGKGYVEAGAVRVGDELIYAEKTTRSRKVPAELSGVRGEAGEASSLGEEILREGVQEEGDQRRVPSPLPREKALQDVRGAGEQGRYDLLQLPLPVGGVFGREASSVCRQDRGGLCLLPEEDHDPTVEGGPGEVLFPGLCEQEARREDARPREPELHPRGRVRAVLGRVHTDAEGGEEAGRLLLPALRQDGEAERGEHEYPSSGLEQGQQSDQQFDVPVSELSHGAAGYGHEAAAHGRTFVVSVERAVRLPEKVYNVRVADTHNYFANDLLVHNCDDPLDPEQSFSEAEIKIANRWMTHTLPSRKVDKVICPLVLVQQRLHANDPTGDLLENSKREGAFPIRHIKLPAEDGFDIQPPELKAKYIDGLMDPVRLPWSVLKAERARSEYSYISQYGQDPKPVGSRMFEEEYFNQRVKSAPYNCQRIRYWDRAASSSQDNPNACYTAGVLIARDPEGNYYVEHVVRGQWEPTKRNEKMKACALRDRTKYGKYEPVIWVEREGGSSGRDAWKGVARALAGFVVKEDSVSGKKEVRAEPWSTQLAAKNVYLVEDGTWDIRAYVEEHLSFPHTKLKDQVDASTGAFNLLCDIKRIQPMRVLPIRSRKTKGEAKFVVCPPETIPELRDSGLFLVVNVRDYGEEELPVDLEGCENALDYAAFSFPDFDPEAYQDRWEEPVPRYGLLPQELIPSREYAKKVWAFLLKPRDPYPSRVVFTGNLPLAESVARGVMEAMRLPEDSLEIIDSATVDGGGYNRHLLGVIRSSRNLVYG